MVPLARSREIADHLGRPLQTGLTGVAGPFPLPLLLCLQARGQCFQLFPLARGNVPCTRGHSTAREVPSSLRSDPGEPQGGVESRNFQILRFLPPLKSPEVTSSDGVGVEAGCLLASERDQEMLQLVLELQSYKWQYPHSCSIHGTQ